MDIEVIESSQSFNRRLFKVETDLHDNREFLKLPSLTAIFIHSPALSKKFELSSPLARSFLFGPKVYLSKSYAKIVCGKFSLNLNG